MKLIILDGLLRSTALVIGLFLHISTTILFEADSNTDHQIAYDRLGAILLGAGLAILGAV